MAILLKDQLYQSIQIRQPIMHGYSSIEIDNALTEATMNYTNPAGEESTFEYDPKAKAGSSTAIRLHYKAPFVNILKKGKSDPKTCESATRIFYDFYAIELMHRFVGSPIPDPDLNNPKYAGEFTPQQKHKYKSAIAQAGLQGGNTMGVFFVPDWNDVEFHPSGVSIVPFRLRKIIDQVFDEVVIQVSDMLMAHLRLTLVQEFRYFISLCPDWQLFRHKLVGIYNKNSGKISKSEFNAAVAEKIPVMKGNEDAVKRLLKFCKYYSPMSPDPADAASAEPVEPIVGKPPIEPKAEPEPEPEEPSVVQTPLEPDDTDYDMPPVEVPPGAESEDDPVDYSDELKKVNKDKLKQWIDQKKVLTNKYLLKYKKGLTGFTESINNPSYAVGRLSPHTILKLKKAIDKSGLTWNDIMLGYNKFKWNQGYGGPKWGAGVEAYMSLMPKAKSKDIEAMAGQIDHIYDLYHNNGELLDKGGMYVPTIELDRRAKIISLSRYLPNVSTLIQRLILRVLPYVSKHPEIEKDIQSTIHSPVQPFTPEQQTFLEKNKFVKSPSGEEWTVHAPFTNKKNETVNYKYTVKFHKNGLFSIADSMDADVQVFATWPELEEILKHYASSFVKSTPGQYNYAPSTPTKMSEKDKYLSEKVKIKLSADKETKLLEECKMAWRPSNSYYKAHLPNDNRFQFYAFSDGTFMGCVKSTGMIGVKSDNWSAAFEHCKNMTANALPLPSSEYDEGKAWIGLSMTAPPPKIIPSKAVPTSPSVGAPPPVTYITPESSNAMSSVEVHTLQILASQHSGIKVVPNAMPGVSVTFAITIGGYDFISLIIQKKAISSEGKNYVVTHFLTDGKNENWHFANWNQTYSFVEDNFSLLTQVASEVAHQIFAPTSPSIMAQVSSTPMGYPSLSKASYTAHVGIDKPPSHTIRLTTEDENEIKKLGFEPKMVGTDVWYVHKTIADTVKFFPNDVAKILVLNKDHISVVITKKIEEALEWLKVNYSGATQSPILAPPQDSPKGSKAGAMYEKILSTAGFNWDPVISKYIKPNSFGYDSTITIKPFPKSTLVDGAGSMSTFDSLPALVAYLKNIPQDKKKILTPPSDQEIDVVLASSGFKLIDGTSDTVNVYKNNSTGQIIVYDKSNKKSISKTSDGESQHFDTPDVLVNYLATIPSLSQSANSLSETEMGIIEEIVQSYGLTAKVKHIGSKIGANAYIAIMAKDGIDTLYNIRKLDNKFHFNKLPSVGFSGPSSANSIVFTPDWDKMISCLHEQLKPYKIEPADPSLQNLNNSLSETEIGIIEAIVFSYGLTAKVKYIDHPIGNAYIHIVAKDGVDTLYTIRKLDNKFHLQKIPLFDSPILEPVVIAPEWEKLILYLHEQLKPYKIEAPDKPTDKPAEGITLKDYQQIKEAVDSYGESVWSEYVHAAYGQSAYVEVTHKPKFDEPGTIIFSIGKLGNFYQINDDQNKPKDNSPTLAGIIARIHSILSAIASQAEVHPEILKMIGDLATSANFNSIKPEEGKSLTYVKGGNETISVGPHGAVTYTHKGVMGPIHTKNPQVFTNWFQIYYLKGQVPDTAAKFNNSILNLLNSGEFLEQDKFTILHSKKVNAIKALRVYIMQVTGGPCGLAKTKWAIENLGQFLDYIKLHGLPNMDGNNDEFLVHLGEPPPAGDVPTKLLDDEKKTIGDIVIEHLPNLSGYDPTGDAMIIWGWVGDNSVNYKITKEENVYRVYTDNHTNKNGEWIIQKQVSTFNELTAYIEDLVTHIAKALKNSKLKHPLAKTTPSHNPEKLSVTEVEELKKLVKKFKLTISTMYTKKLTEDTSSPEEAYSLGISDPVHKVWLKITKDEGEYVISKGVNDAYFPIRKFNTFEKMLVYLDYYLNSYVKEEPTEVDKIDDDELKIIKDLVKEYKPKAKVRRKYMTSKESGGKVPYVFIETGELDSGGKNYVLSKMADGTYKLFEANNSFDEWKIISTANSWEEIYDVISKEMKNEPLPDEGNIVPEGKLASLMANAGYNYINTTTLALDANVSKNAKVYDNDEDERIYLFDDGSSRVWYKETKETPSGSKVMVGFKTIPELIAWMEMKYENKVSSELIDIQNQLEVIGFKTENKFHQWTTKWDKTSISNLKPVIDHVELHADGSSTVTPARSVLAGTSKPKSFFFNTYAILKQYLTDKYLKPKSWIDAYFTQVLVKGKFQKIEDQLTEMGFKWTNDKLIVVPFPSGGVMQTVDDSDPISFSYESTYDLAKRIDILLEYSDDYVGLGWSTGDESLNDIIIKSGFVYHGQENSQEGTDLIFLHSNGTKLHYYTLDGNSEIVFPATQANLAFTNNQDLKNYLSGAAGMSTTSQWPSQQSSDDDYAKSYYDDLGHYTNVYSIRLTKEDDDRMKKLGWIFKPSHETNSVAAYYNSHGYRAVFYNRKVDESKPVCRISDMNKLVKEFGLHLYKYPYQVVTFLEANPSASYGLTPDKFSTNDGSILTNDFNAKNLITKDLKDIGAPAGSIDSIYFQSSHASENGEIHILGGNVLKFAIGKKIVGTNVVWYIRQAVSDDPSGMYRVYTFVEHHKDAMVEWIKNNITNLVTHKSIKDADGHNLGQAEGPLNDQGEMYYPGPEILDLLKSKGFKSENLSAYGNKWVHPSGFYFELYEKAINWHFSQGAKGFGILKDDQPKFLEKALANVTPGVNEEAIDQMFIAAMPSQEDTDHEMGAMTPSGKAYKTHDVEGNADMIWLNVHDAELLQLMEFMPFPSENPLYKNPQGNIIKFFDTGKAEYIDYFGHPDKPENGEVTTFDNIPHALKFVVVKHSVFSNQDYKSDVGGNVVEIQLNPHDDAIMKQLGFHFDKANMKYIKELGSNDMSKVQEAINKDAIKDDKYEVFTAYDTGYAIWQYFEKDTEEQTEEGKILIVLAFIWKRWKHKLAGNIKTIPVDTQQDLPGPLEPVNVAINKPNASQTFLDLDSFQAPPFAHKDFGNRGFEYDPSTKSYYKKYNEFVGTCIKWTGNVYVISHPHTTDEKIYTYREFSSSDLYYVLVTIKKIENADFGNFVQSEDDALKKGDANYFNAPNGWTPYQPYAPKKNPTNIKPEDWIHKELDAYGFEWMPDSAMYSWKDINGKVGTSWQAVRFDKNGTIVYFYHTAEGNPRYFCSKDFSQIQLRIEKYFLMGTSTGAPKKIYPLDPKNYSPTVPEWNTYSVTNKAVKLIDSDHKAVLQAGFVFNATTNTYENYKTKDKFKIFEEGFVWYKFTGMGEGGGMDNSIGHFFDMLKSKYGELEWGFHPLSKYEIDQLKSKMKIIGFAEQTNKLVPNDLYFDKLLPDNKTTLKIKEVVVVFPNHTMEFCLYDTAGVDRLLGSFVFESLTYGLHVLEDHNTSGIKLLLATDLSAELILQGFIYVSEETRYEHAFGSGGLKVCITFFGNGQAQAQLMRPDNSEGYEEVKEKKFTNFYDAILWSASKNFEASTPEHSTMSSLKQSDEVPYSGHDYNQPSEDPKKKPVYTTISLIPQDEETLNKMGFVRVKTENVIWYEKTGIGQFVEFFADGHASINDMGTGTKKDQFPTVKECLQFLWDKFKPSIQGNEKKKVLAGTEDMEDMPYSGATYKIKDSHHYPTTVNLYDENVLKSIGFERDTNVKGYFKKISDTIDEVFEVFDDGTSQWRTWTTPDANAPLLVISTDPTKFSSVKEGMEFLWNKHKPSTQKKPKVTGEMTYSGTDYAEWWKNYWADVPPNTSIALNSDDVHTLAKIGFVEKINDGPDTDIAFKVIYENKGGTDRAFFFASGIGAYWKTPEDGPYYHNTVKDLMQFLWDKYSVFIEEGIIKDLVSMIMEHPHTAKLLK